MATAISSTSTIGLNHDIGILVATSAPAAEPRPAMIVSGRTVRRSGRTLTPKVTALVAVPNKEEILLVDRICAGDALGSPSSIAGNWINPPPPTTASTQPAENAATTSSTRVQREMSGTAANEGRRVDHRSSIW